MQYVCTRFTQTTQIFQTRIDLEEPILRLLNLQLQRQRRVRLERF
jgi:hypothetical protein